VSSGRPVLVESAAHPALVAWRRLRGAAPARPAPVQRLQKRNKGVVYRLVGVGRGGYDVVAKWSSAERIARESLIYEEVLPAVPVSSVRYYGALDDPDAGGSWLFIGYAGGERYEPASPGHRALAARWLAGLHTAVPWTGPPAGLPVHGTAHYLRTLDSARAEIMRGLDDPGLTRADIALLTRVVSRYRAIAARWDELEAILALTPPTIVHGDFAPKNIRVAGVVLRPFDWGSAGWGSPAVDLAQVDAAPSTCWASADLALYLSQVGDAWPGLSLEDLGRLAIAGKILRTLTCMNLDAPGLMADWRERALANMRFYAWDLDDSLRAARWA